MTEPVGENNIAPLLSALVDGELDAEQAAGALRYLAEQPSSAAVANVYLNLRETSGRVMAQPAVRAPDALRMKIEHIKLDDLPKPMTLGFSPTRLAACAAALLLLGTLVGYFAIPRKSEVVVRPLVPERSEITIAPTLVDAITRVHVDCSRFVAEMHAGGIPQELHGLSEAISTDLAKGGTYPDLSSAGYAIIGAGPCRLPAENTVHLLYRSTEKNVRDTLSIFAQPFTNQIAVEPGKTYLVTHPGTAHPMIVWRTAETVYFLVGDDIDEVQRAEKSIGLAGI